MPLIYRAPTQYILIDLLCTVVRRPSRHCSHEYLFRTSSRRHASSTPSSTKRPSLPTALDPGAHIPMRMLLDRNPENLSTISRIPIPAGTPGERFVPQPLARPLGLPYPPEPGQNSPVDQRTFAQKKADYSNYEKALERRRVLFRQFLRPYFQDWKRLDKEFKGKSFVSNERLFRKEKALWFPNMWGPTLQKEVIGPDGGKDLVNVLKGRVSLVGIQSGGWAEEQVQSFLGEREGQNPKLKGLVEGSGGLVQRVDINAQGDWVRQLLVRLFKGRLRKMMPATQWGKYFMVRLARDVRKGLTEDVRDAMGFLNSQVGYVYLLDTDCRIRWAGSGHAWKGEVESLNMGIRRLIEEAREGNRVERKNKSRLSISTKESKPGQVAVERNMQRAVA